MLQVTPLSSLPYNCLLLTLDSLSILLNAGHPPSSRLPANLPSHLDFILLSHSTPQYINALPRIALSHPHTQIYSTVPIATLGRLSTLEATPPGPTVSDVKTEDDELPEYLTPRDVEKTFDRITTVRYSQPVILSHGVTVTAYPAGHSIGGTIWNLRKDQENVVVMLGWNHAKERIVRGMLDVKTLRLLERASCVITDVRGSSIPQVPTRKVREQFLVDSVTAALDAGQNVLIPSLPPTRTLDLLLLLDNAFTTTPSLQKFPIFYLAHTSLKAVTATKTMLEWLSNDMSLQDKPLDFKYIKIVTQYPDLTLGPLGPRVVIVDNLDLQPLSFAHQAFLDFRSSGHLLLLTSHSPAPDSTTAHLLNLWESMSPRLSPDQPRPIIALQTQTQVTLLKRIPLQGEELLQWRRKDRLSREQKDADEFFEERQRNLLEGAADSDSEEDEQEQLLLDEDDITATSLAPTYRVRGSAILLQDTTYDFFLRDVAHVTRAALKQFPLVDKRVRFDDFGVALGRDEYVRVEEDVGPPGLVVAVAARRESVGVGGKRKWGEMEKDGASGVVEELPARVETTTMDVDVNIRIGYVDLEGLHDGRAASTLLPRLNARKLVVMNSTQEDVDAFKTTWEDIPRVTREVYIPTLNETIDVSVTTHQYDLRLSDDLAKTLKWQTVQNQQIAHLIGSIVPPPPHDQLQNDLSNGNDQHPEVTTGALVKPLPTLHPLTLSSVAVPAARPLHVGEVRLLELKTRLQKEGYNAVLGEGVLVCDGVVRVMKEEGGRGVRIEGVVGEGTGSLKAFWDVRRAVYEGLAVV